MNNLQYIIFFSFFTAAGVYFWSFLRRLKQDYVSKVLSRSLLENLSGKGAEIFFCEPVIRQTASLLGKNKTTEKVFHNLLRGRPKSAEKYLLAHGRELDALILSAHFAPEKAAPRLEKYIKKHPDSQQALCALAELYFLSGQKDAGRRVLDCIRLPKAPLYVKGAYWYWQTGFYLKEGDMQSASQACSQAAKYFIKGRYFYAAARAYLLMGTIYRVCFVDDVASFMFRGALDLFRQLKYIPGQAAAYGSLGMLNAASEHFDEAEAYFRQAEELFSGENMPGGQAEIINQLGLLNILRGDYAAAQKHLKAASAKHKENACLPGLAFNAELFSYWAAAVNDDKACLRYARKAEMLYSETGNETAYLESLYLQAEALFRQQQDEKAEKILRRIISYAGTHTTAFHVANAYSLLGLSFMRRGELSRAKGLFQQSLEQEQKNDRWIGQVCDYANIGLLELRSGKNEQAQTHLQAAYELAQALGDTVLAEKIKVNLDKLKS